MNTWTTHQERRLKDLSRQECLDLLGSKTVGRVAFCTAKGPVVLPVNYTMYDGKVLFRTSSYGSIASHLRDSPAAFEVDDVDDATRSGWSVLLAGHASFVEYPDLPPDRLDRPEPWADGSRMLHIRINPTELTGRRLHAD
jgi:uncharacterized protein